MRVIKSGGVYTFPPEGRIADEKDSQRQRYIGTLAHSDQRRAAVPRRPRPYALYQVAVQRR